MSWNWPEVSGVPMGSVLLLSCSAVLGQAQCSLELSGLISRKRAQCRVEVVTVMFGQESQEQQHGGGGVYRRKRDM